ncbi:MAG: hypothetical protein IJ466_01880 [Clostridia bacterium]|nr:hypothetical protein [Clostridia bacterium]
MAEEKKIVAPENTHHEADGVNANKHPERGACFFSLLIVDGDSPAAYGTLYILSFIIYSTTVFVCGKSMPHPAGNNNFIRTRRFFVRTIRCSAGDIFQLIIIDRHIHILFVIHGFVPFA